MKKREQKKAQKKLSGLAKSSPFATKRSTNRKLFLITPLSIAVASWTAVIIRSRQSSPTQMLAKSSQKMQQQIERTTESIDLRDHPQVEEALAGAKSSLGQLSSVLQHDLGGTAHRTPVHVGA